MLMEKGFITPVSLHYVRNHGAVPKLDWDTHKVKVLLCDTLYTLLQRSLPCPVCVCCPHQWCWRDMGVDVFAVSIKAIQAQSWQVACNLQAQ